MENVKCKIACGRGGGEKGSALLIVLGMFAFMLVSAVAFSMYMRASRAPSSYVRRNASARQLVKAALARAIDEVDTAIGNDPFPGVGRNNNCTGQVKKTRADSQPEPTKDRGAYDNWHGRVFTPKDEVLDAGETVSTLTLEGLGYLPPCLVNEVRYWSRHTRTARMKKQPFSYGLGRYAFTAVNVSDFFDVNNFGKTKKGKIHQYLNRSSAPHGRVSPTYLFRGGETAEMIAGAGDAKDFLDDMASGVGGGGGDYPSASAVPFVSWLDFYLAVGDENKWGLSFPFYNLINDKKNSNVFFSDSDKDKVRHSVFMAGGWNCDTNLAIEANDYLTKYKKLNLRYPEHQPFHGENWVINGGAKFDDCMKCKTDFWNKLGNEWRVLQDIDKFLLCDYLDCDSVPISLCLPSVEAVPMLCGVALNPKCVKYELDVVDGGWVKNDDTGEQTREVTYFITVIIDDLSTSITTVYPFLSDSPRNYTVESFARVFFVEEGAASVGSPLRNEFFNLGDSFVWGGKDGDPVNYMQVDMKNGTAPAVAPNGTGEGREKATITGDIEKGVSRNGEKTVLATVTYKKDKDGNIQAPAVNDPRKISFYNADLKDRIDFGVEFAKNPDPDTTPSPMTKYRPNVAIWMRIKDDAGKTVDMAPAVPAYDNLNDDAAIGLKEDESFYAATCGEGARNLKSPALRFFPSTANSAAGIEFNHAYFAANKGTHEVDEWQQTAYAVNDPRYNWAPEHWYVLGKDENPRDRWFENVKSFRVGKGQCDQDIFMSVSDQGYLQSMYEVMMIPQTHSINPKDPFLGWGSLEGDANKETVGYDGKIRNSVGGVANDGLMWRTYKTLAFCADGEDPDAESNWGYIDRQMSFDEADNGLRVNPYTDNMNIMLGAFANMPCDWWAAGTNYVVSGKDYMKPGENFEKANLFKWSYEKDVAGIANGAYNMAYFWSNAFKRRFEESDKAKRDKLCVTDDWKDIFDDAFYWYGGEVEEKYRGCLALDPDRDLSAVADSGAIDNSAVDKILKSLTSVDRKFLYGYLKGCFANTSQLFLFFVRAEASIGGAAGDGARAVALVWRDPNPPTGTNGKLMNRDGNNGSVEVDSTDKATDNSFVYSPDVTSWRYDRREFPPHRTRILFYHQFD